MGEPRAFSRVAGRLSNRLARRVEAEASITAHPSSEKPSRVATLASAADVPGPISSESLVRGRTRCHRAEPGVCQSIDAESSTQGNGMHRASCARVPLLFARTSPPFDSSKMARAEIGHAPRYAPASSPERSLTSCHLVAAPRQSSVGQLQEGRRQTNPTDTPHFGPPQRRGMLRPARWARMAFATGSQGRFSGPFRPRCGKWPGVCHRGPSVHEC